MEVKSILMSLSLGLALSACCGFRVFVPLLVAAVAAKLGWLPTSSGFEWMGTYPAIIAFSVAAVAEISAYYFPFIDNLLDTVTTPASVVAGTAISASTFVDFDPMLKWTLALIAGGGAAGIIQAGTGLLRLGSSKFTAGTANPVVATGENVFSVVGSLLSLLVPVVMAIAFIVLIAILLYFLLSRIKKAATG
jgi:hypothetical protein